MKRLELRHILCPIDFSPLSAGLLATASAMARARHAELRAFHVVPAEGPGSPEDSIPHQTLMSQLRTHLAEADPTYELIGAAVRHGDPATHILRFARSLPADVIVIGAPGADRPERPVGPVGAVVVARSECSVLAVPANHPKRQSKKAGLFSRIVCAVDLAPSSASVVHQALSLAWETGGSLTYLCVLPEDTPLSPADVRERLRAAIPPEARDWCEMDVIVTKGVASHEIVREANERNVDLTVIGAPRRWTSMTHAVLSGSLCPVLVTHDARPLPRPVVEPPQHGVRTAASRK